MPDVRELAARLTREEREALLSLTGEAGDGSISPVTAARLNDDGLAVIRPDGCTELSDLGKQVLQTLRAGH